MSVYISLRVKGDKVYENSYKVLTDVKSKNTYIFIKMLPTFLKGGTT